MNQLINQPANDVIDINLEFTKKKRFRINKDDSKILELATTDLSIVDRFKTKFDEIIKVVEDGFKNSSETTDMEDLASSIKSVDAKMRKLIDEIFDSNVSEICAPSGSMLDPINGEFRFEHIFNTLIPLYEGDITTELDKFNTRIQKHTSKYIK